MATRNVTADFLQLRATFRRAPGRRSGVDGSHTIEMADIRATLSDKRKLLSQSGISFDESAAGVSSLPPVWMDAVDELQYELTRIKQKLTELAGLHKKHLLPGFDDRVEEEQTIEILTQDLTFIFKQCESQLKRINDVEATSKQELQLRKNIQTSFASQLRDLSQQFRADQREYLQSLKRMQDRGMEIIGDPSILEDSTGMDEYYDRGFTPEQLSQLETTQTVVGERSREITHIAKSITDLAEIFQDLSVLVIDQGTILDRIDYNIEQVVQHTEGALEETRKASKLQKKYRNKLCILLLIVLVVIMAILLIFKSGGSGDAESGS